MVKFLRPAAALLAAALVIWAAVAFLAGDERPAPPLGGAMRNFSAADAGSPAPQSFLGGKDGATTTLQTFRGKVVLVNFWATWCAPCIKELPSLVSLQAKLGGAGFTVLALSEDLKGWPVIAPFLAQHGIAGLPVLHDPQGAASRALKVAGLPTSVLFDRDGHELGRLVGPADWGGPDALALIRHYLPAKR
jgi:thiol-disulfide isomerase/thioredoxin